MVADPIVSYSSFYPPPDWSAIHERLSGESGSTTWQEMTDRYHEMLYNASAAYQTFLTNDKVTKLTAEDFVLDPTCCGRSLVNEHHQKRDSVWDAALEMIEEEGGSPEQWSETSTIASTISSSSHFKKPVIFTTLGNITISSSTIERSASFSSLSSALTDPPKEADRTAPSPSPIASADPPVTGAYRSALSLPATHKSYRSKFKRKAMRVLKALSCFA